MPRPFNNRQRPSNSQRPRAIGRDTAMSDNRTSLLQLLTTQNAKVCALLGALTDLDHHAAEGVTTLRHRMLEVRDLLGVLITMERQTAESVDILRSQMAEVRDLVHLQVAAIQALMAQEPPP
jgi:hypothetical protein